MAGYQLVAVIEHRGDRRRLAGARRADHEDQAAPLHDQVLQDFRQLQRI
jgi:hypothetical protein